MDARTTIQNESEVVQELEAARSQHLFLEHAQVWARTRRVVDEDPTTAFFLDTHASQRSLSSSDFLALHAHGFTVTSFGEADPVSGNDAARVVVVAVLHAFAGR